MATKTQFLSELDAHIAMHLRWIREISAELDSLSQQQQDLQKNEQAILEDFAKQTLPDLSTSAINRARAVFPELPSPEEVAASILKSRTTLQGHLSKLLADFDPEGAPGERNKLKHELEKFEEILRFEEGALSQILEVRGLRSLIQNGYGTNRYAYSWLQRQYYRDWAMSDEVVDAFQLNNWREVLVKYNEKDAAVTENRNLVKNLKKKIEVLGQRLEEHTSLRAALDGVKNAVLDTLRVQIKSQANGVRHGISELVVNDRKREDVQQRMSSLQGNRQQVSDRLTELQQLRGKVFQSKKQQVSDDFVRRLQDSRLQTGGQVPVYVTDDNWLTNYLLYQAVLDNINLGHVSHARTQDSSPASYLDENRYGRVS